MRPLSLAALLTLTGLASGSTLNVPGSYATIQAGINAASNGDTVLVAPGTYFEAIDFLGLDITVRSSGGAAQTVIDGQSASTVVFFVSGESNAAVLQGFTVRNGRGGPGGPGAVLCTNSDPTLLDCVFEGNVGGASFVGVHGGPGAIACSTASPVILRCEFLGNLGGDGAQQHEDGGAGVFQCVSTAAIQLRDCLFEGNTGGPGLGGNSHGGPGVLHRRTQAALVMDNCVLRANRGGDGNGAGGAGAILAAGGCSQPCVPPGLLVQGSRFSDNVGGQGDDGGPGAVHVTSGEPIFLECTFSHNEGGDAVAGIGSEGGAGVVRCTAGGEPTFESCLMSDNLGGDAVAEEARCGGPGAIYAAGGSGSMLLDKCTIQRNRGGLGGAGILDHGGTGGVQVENSFRMNLVNCILVANVGAGAGPVPGGGFEPGDLSGVGGAEVDNGWLRLTNCTVAFNVGGPVNPLNNDGAVGGLLLNQHSWLINSIVWGNTGSTPRQNLISSTNVLNDAAIVDYCCLGEPYNHPGLANLVTDPVFADSAADDYRLDCDSPCIDAGVASAPDLPDEDFEGDPRPVGIGVDIGADESTTDLLGVNYCIAASNSSGVGATISAQGRPSVAENCVTLLADGVPGTPGLFFYGPNQIQVSFGDGFRCIGGALRRLPPSSSVGGVLRRELDLPTTSISGGSVWNFQAWYRDPVAGGAGFNTSDGLEVSFQP